LTRKLSVSLYFVRRFRRGHIHFIDRRDASRLSKAEKIKEFEKYFQIFSLIQFDFHQNTKTTMKKAPWSDGDYKSNIEKWEFYCQWRFCIAKSEQRSFELIDCFGSNKRRPKAWRLKSIRIESIPIRLAQVPIQKYVLKQYLKKSGANNALGICYSWNSST
jgi:hypothetical protein